MTSTFENRDNASTGRNTRRPADLRAEALMDEDLAAIDEDFGQNYDGDQYDRSERAALRRVVGLSTELEDVTEVEYRQLRLERVVLVGVWTDCTA